MVPKSGRAAREDREKILLLKHKFENRITVVRFGKKSLDAGDYPGALKKFYEYMQLIADVKKVKDIYSITPEHFNSTKDLTEMLMISHVYFEMARVYDAVPKFADEAKKCLDQFVLFSANQPYQVVNSEMIRKYLKKSIFKNPEAFRSAYQQIYVQSKKCYVVTFCYGDQHPITQEFRKLKDKLLDSPSGQELIRIYYKFSSELVPRYEKNFFVKIFSRICLRPALLLFSKTLLKFMIK